MCSRSRYLPVASALNCSASSINDNPVGPGLAATKICSDVCTDIPGWPSPCCSRAALALFTATYKMMDRNYSFLIADLLQRPGMWLL